MWRAVVGASIGLIIIVVGLFGIGQSNATPQEVFWAAVRNSMNTTGLTIKTTSTASGTKEVVLSQLDFGQYPKTRMLSELSTGGAVAKAETLTTPSAQYTRYDYIRKLKNGKPEDFSRVIGLWAKVARYSHNEIPEAYAQVLLDQLLPLPIGNLTNSERASLFEQIQDGQIYTINFAKTKRTTYQGRPAYTYAVSIQPVLYLQLIKSYAPDLNMHQLDQLNPNTYDGEPNVQAAWTVDVKSKQLVEADYGNGRVQTYSGWGVPITTTVPTHTVSATELENLLGDVQ